MKKGGWKIRLEFDKKDVYIDGWNDGWNEVPPDPHWCDYPPGILHDSYFDGYKSGRIGDRKQYDKLILTGKEGD